MTQPSVQPQRAASALPSARQILAPFQHLQVDDWVPMGGKMTPYTACHVARLEPGKLMLWRRAAASGCGCWKRTAPGARG
jgi:hypothetical protein